MIESNIYENGELPYVRTWVSGGISGKVYKVTVTIDTTNHRRLQDEFKIKVKEF